MGRAPLGRDEDSPETTASLKVTFREDVRPGKLDGNDDNDENDQQPTVSSAIRKQSMGARLKELRFQSQVNLDDFDQDDKLVRQLSREVDHLLQSATEYDESEGTKSNQDIIRDVFDISSTLNDAASALVDDSFLRCFKSAMDEPWNWNFYLFPLWLVGVVVRNFILFPLRLITLLLGFVIFFILFHVRFRTCRDRRSLMSRISISLSRAPRSFLRQVSGLILRSGERRTKAERAAVHFLAQVFIVSWTGVVRYHGPRPVPKAGRVWVANHSSMIDYAVLSALTPFAAIMQLHKGWVGVMQKRYLAALGCLWFNRTETKDRALVSQKMKAHIMAEGRTPLLIFPEGTCVNNEYCVMFKVGFRHAGPVLDCSHILNPSLPHFLTDALRPLARSSSHTLVQAWCL